jgi:hypothetical protein
MNDHLRRFKQIVAQVSHETGVNLHRWGLADLIQDAGSDPSPALLVALAASYFCEEDDQYNGSAPGLEVVLQFLGETSKMPPQGADAAADLIALLNDGANVQRLTEWASAYYAT